MSEERGEANISHERFELDLTQLSTSVPNSKHLSLQLGVDHMWLSSHFRSHDLDVFISFFRSQESEPQKHSNLEQILSNDPKTQQAPHWPFEEGLQECREESVGRPRKNQSAPTTAAPTKLLSLEKGIGELLFANA